ncbi:MAG: hypothetical protein JXN64_00035 [Spirochaetes bacterium]|nr:hypothetical protein [Spirochaetota bacterium]
MRRSISLIMFSLFILAGCASVPKFPADTKFSVDNFKVNLKQKLQVEGYPAEAELTGILKEKINTTLKQKNLLTEHRAGNAMSVSIIIDYTRRFAGEDTPVPSKSVMAPEFGYTIVISENGVEKRRISEAKLEIKKGFLSNLATVATLGLGNDAKDELKDVQDVANYIAEKIEETKK